MQVFRGPFSPKFPFGVFAGADVVQLGMDDVDLSKLSRIELARMAVAGEKTKRSLARREAKRRLEATKRGKAGMTAVKRLAIAAVASTVPAYVIEKNPDLKYVDEDETIETEAAVSLGLLGAGLVYYLMKPDGTGAEELFDAGLIMTACWANNRAREMAREDLAEDANAA